MTREEADDAFDCLSRHARAIATPDDAAAALKLVDAAALAQLQRDAIVHYITTGPAVVNLAYRVLKAGTATFVAARFAAGAAGGEGSERERFAARLTAAEGPFAAAAGPAALLDALDTDLAGGRALLGAQAADDGVGDLLEAAGIAYMLAGQLENPPLEAA